MPPTKDFTEGLDKEAKAQLKTIEDAAFERGKTEGLKAEGERLATIHAAAVTEAKAEGAKAERERIQAVENVSLPGHEALIADLKFDGKTTGPEAAQRVLGAEKTARDRRLANLKSDAPAPAPAAAPPESSAAAEANLPVEDRAKKAWELDAKLREEFTNLEAYTAFLKADAAGSVRILSRASQ